MTKRNGSGKSSTNPTRNRPKNAITRARSKQWPDVFIRELRKRGIVLDAAKVARVDRTTAYLRRSTNSEFAQQWDDALLDAVDEIESEAFRRAVKGVLKPVYQQGRLVGHVKEYSDSLMALLLKANLPHKFNERMRLDVYDWRKEAEAAGVNPDEVLSEFERIVAAKMEAGGDGGGVAEHQDAEKLDAPPASAA